MNNTPSSSPEILKANLLAGRELTRKDKILLVVMLSLEALIDKGFITGPKLLTEKGREEAKAIDSKALAMTQEEMRWAMDALTGR